VDHLASRWEFPAWRRDRLYRITEGTFRRRAVRLVKPLTYMNRSGAALAPLRASAPFDPPFDLLVVVDEAALPAGSFRLRSAGSAGGHNGLKSIEAALGNRDYPRLRIGVGPVPPGIGGDMAEFVLEAPDPDDYAAIRALLDPMADAIECWVTEGIDLAMTRFNKRISEG
jgi:PTH1 family peptidyl-tRNA hydrolase